MAVNNQYTKTLYTAVDRQPRPSSLISWLRPLTGLVRTPSRAPAWYRYIYQRVGHQVITSTLKMGTESVPEMENFYTLTWLSAQEGFIEFCHCESLKTYKWKLKLSNNLSINHSHSDSNNIHKTTYVYITLYVKSL
jgi:hypothetical protein